MALALLILEATAPIFLVGALGWVWMRAGQPFPTDFTTRLALNASMPALLFAALARSEFTMEEFLALSGATLAAFVAATAVTYAALRALGLGTRAWLLALVNGNTGNLGLPLALFAFGEEGLAAAVVVFCVQMVLTFTGGLWLLSGEASARDILRQPVLYGMAAGLAVKFSGIEAPLAIMRSVDLAGQMAIPLMLMALGVSVARMNVADLGASFVASVLRMVPVLGAGLGAAWAFGLPAALGNALILQLATPAAVTSYLLAERYGRNAERVAGLVVVSTVLSVFYLPAVLALMLGEDGGWLATLFAPR